MGMVHHGAPRRTAIPERDSSRSIGVARRTARGLLRWRSMRPLTTSLVAIATLAACGGGAAAPLSRLAPDLTLSDPEAPPLRGIATLAPDRRVRVTPTELQFDDLVELRYDAATGRVIAGWFGGDASGRITATADLVDPETATIEPWDAEPSAVGQALLAEVGGQEALLGRWQHEIEGIPGAIVWAETRGIVRREPDGGAPRLLFRGEVLKLRVAPSGAAAWMGVDASSLVLQLHDGDDGDPLTVNDPTITADLLEWSRDGAYLYAFGETIEIPAESMLRRCLVRVTAATGTVEPLRCGAASERVEAIVAPEGTRAVVLTTNREGGRKDLELIALPGGESLGQLRNVFVNHGVIDERDRLVAVDGGGLMVIVMDFARGTVATTSTNPWQITALRPEARLPGGEWLTLGVELDARGRDELTPELVAFDVERMLRKAPNRAPEPLELAIDPDAPTSTAAGAFWTDSAPCPERATLVEKVTVAGTEWTCVAGGGRRHGRYALVRDGRLIARGEYRDDLRHGQWTWWSGADRAVLDAHFVDGVEHGELRAWHANGRLALRAPLRRARRHGERNRWHVNGELAERRHHDDDRDTGIAEERSFEGTLRRRTEYDDDGAIAREIWYSGTRRTELRYEAGRRHELRELDGDELVRTVCYGARNEEMPCE
jgi:hypothetical protein